MKDSQEAVTQTEQKTEVTDTQSENKNEDNVEVKTFTQDDFNAFEKKLKAKYDKKYEDIDIKEYREWKESQKTETEKQNETLIENEKLKNRIAQLENQSTVANADVDKKFVKFVTSEVSQMDGDFEDNLKEYLKENPQFLNSKVETQDVQKNTGVATQKLKENAESGVASILKAKHPNLNL